MSITMSYRRLSPEALTTLENDSKAEENYFYGDDAHDNTISVYNDVFDASVTRLELEKEWQAIHYLLTGEIDFNSDNLSPSHQVVMGGTPTKWESSYGPIRLLSTEEVKKCAMELNALPKEVLRARFETRGDAQIYGQDDTWNENDEDAWEIVLQTSSCVAQFFDQAARENQVILISSD